MKFIKLNCTRGGVKNPILSIGDEISLDEAQSLVDERIAVEYFPDSLGGSDSRIKELEGQVSDLTARNTELEGQLALLDQKPATGKK